ncbi:ribosomal protein S7, partial [Ceraceosorus guamensis]
FGYTKDSLPFRVDPILERFINILMKDGKKQRASRQVHKMLELLSQMTRTNPVVALSRAIQQASPLTRMQSQRQGARTLQVPIALNERQGQRRAIQGIINASEKRNDRDLSARLALEVCAVLDGTSNVLAKKEEAHKIATMNRSNL